MVHSMILRMKGHGFHSQWVQYSGGPISGDDVVGSGEPANPPPPPTPPQGSPSKSLAVGKASAHALCLCVPLLARPGNSMSLPS